MLTTSSFVIITEENGMGAMKRKPVHPGEMLLEEFMPDYGLSVAELADGLGVSRQSVNELVRGKKALTPEMALRLSAYFGNSAEQWLNMQKSYDLWVARNKLGKVLSRIKKVGAA
jgi:addiction module HigA family antidote